MKIEIIVPNSRFEDFPQLIDLTKDNCGNMLKAQLLLVRLMHSAIDNQENYDKVMTMKNRDRDILMVQIDNISSKKTKLKSKLYDLKRDYNVLTKYNKTEEEVKQKINELEIEIKEVKKEKDTIRSIIPKRYYKHWWLKHWTQHFKYF